ncbi:MAG: TolC family protein [Chitinophagales bacterium]|nr:TolC family protein [Chitinophagales bacterium]
MLKRLFILLCCLQSCAYAQELLSLDMAIQQALKNNFDIQVARADGMQAEVNNTMGNAGMSPNINATGGVNVSSQNVKINFIDGRTQQVNNAASINYTGSVNLNWTLFDGGKMFLKKKQLNVLEKAGEAQLKEQVQSVVSQVIQSYALAVLQQQQGVAIDTGLLLAKTRMELSRLKFENGSSAKVDYLQARVDYNSRQSDSLQQEASLGASLASLNALMGEDADRPYRVQDELDLDTELLPENKELLEQLNPSLSIAKYNAQASLLNAKMAKTAFMPILALNGGYGYNNTQSQSGFTTFNQSFGPNGGLTLSLPLFRGGNIRREARIASLQSMQYQLLYDKQTVELGKAYRIAWNNYKVAVSAYKLEKQNLEYAKENLYIQKERFKVGIANTLETREAENSYVQSLVRYYTAAYNLKVNETKVLELEGALVK